MTSTNLRMLIGAGSVDGQEDGNQLLLLLQFIYNAVLILLQFHSLTTGRSKRIGIRIYYLLLLLLLLFHWEECTILRISMSISCIQNQTLEITVVECAKLKDTEWISRQDPYVCLEYGSTKFRTRTCTDGGRTPVFQEKFLFTLIEGLREIIVMVWNSNTLTNDDFIGSGKIQLQDVLSKGFDDKCWPIHTKTGRFAGEVKLIMHYSQANRPAVSYGSSAPPYIAPSQPQVLSYSVPPPTQSPYTNPACPPPYLPQSSAYPTSMPYTSYPCYPPPQQAYSSFPYPPPDRSIYPPPPERYPTSTYPPPPPEGYPTSAYPPPPPEGYPTSTYPPPLHASPYPPPSSYGVYPPPQY